CRQSPRSAARDAPRPVREGPRGASGERAGSNGRTSMRVQLRIVAGSLRGRKIQCRVSPELRPTPQMVREALFSILGHAVPDRPFFAVFAGTGANGLEALSRGARFVSFVERDLRLAQDIDSHLRAFGVAGKAQVLRTDVYRWAGQWQPPSEPVNVFVS